MTPMRTVAFPRRETITKEQPFAVVMLLSRTLRPLARPSLVARVAAFSTDAMFCRQCEQTQNHSACTTLGVCGKTPETASAQDTLMDAVQSLAVWNQVANSQEADKLMLQATFATLTNVNFSTDSIRNYVKQVEAVKQGLRGLVSSPPDHALADWKPPIDLDNYQSTLQKAQDADADATSWRELAVYGLKGACAYASHAWALDQVDDDILRDIRDVFVEVSRPDATADELLKAALKVGEINARVLALLDAGHSAAFGTPEPSQVCTTVKEGKCILVSGHDLKDLYELLKQTEGKGINVYTHGEMLPAHAYPKLKAFDHLVGNYGTAWQNQKFEFAAFPGPILVTTNCIQDPRRVYKDRLYSINEVAADGVKHIVNRDFSPLIEQALKLDGFPRTIEPAECVMTGFHHSSIVPDDVIKAVSDGVISRIFLIGGCDGSQFDRNYFTDLAEETPHDSLILTLGCAKNRIIHSKKLLKAKLSNGMPRVLDMGQCNDSYSAVVVATELAKALNCSVNDLPLSIALSHLEQKAAAVLLTLLHLGVENIRLGPSLPAYLSPNALTTLSQAYKLKPTGHFENDLKLMMEGQ